MISLIKNLLARGNDENAWIQILIIAAIIGFGILRKVVSEAKASMKKDSQGDEEGYQDANETIATDEDYRSLEQLREEKIAQIRAAFGIPEPPRQAVPRQVQKRPIPVHRPVVKKAKPFPKAEEAKQIKPVRPQQTEDILLKLSSPQDLRSAILYQEILGPPVALRQ
ncbi:MAG: hypothetical protein PHQ00_02515 [Phycisphaerae bacterium]|nr:hypothetical protein [Phycisphaerae bacterium]